MKCYGTHRAMPHSTPPRTGKSPLELYTYFLFCMQLKWMGEGLSWHKQKRSRMVGSYSWPWWRQSKRSAGTWGGSQHVPSQWENLHSFPLLAHWEKGTGCNFNSKEQSTEWHHSCKQCKTSGEMFAAGCLAKGAGEVSPANHSSKVLWQKVLGM